MKLVAALVLSAALAAGCSSRGDAASGGAEGGTAPGTVTVDDFSFAPETLEAKVGADVTWTVAEGSSAHTVKFEDEESKELAAGDTYSRSFDTEGEQKYVCGIHPQMTGTVNVTQ